MAWAHARVKSDAVRYLTLKQARHWDSVPNKTLTASAIADQCIRFILIANSMRGKEGHGGGQTWENKTTGGRSIGWNKETEIVEVQTGGSRRIKWAGRRWCRRGERERRTGWGLFQADFGSCSVLLQSSWTSLVAGVNYWDWTHTHTQISGQAQEHTPMDVHRDVHT